MAQNLNRLRVIALVRWAVFTWANEETFFWGGWRDPGVSLLGRIFRFSEQPCWLYAYIALQQHSPLPRKFDPSENWLRSRCWASVIIRELLFHRLFLGYSGGYLLSHWKLVELKMLDFSDCTRAGILILKSAADYMIVKKPSFEPLWSKLHLRDAEFEPVKAVYLLHVKWKVLPMKEVGCNLSVWEARFGGSTWHPSKTALASATNWQPDWIFWWYFESILPWKVAWFFSQCLKK